MDNSTRRRNVGRIIFLSQRWIVQTLNSHVSNVAQLAKAWDNRRAFQGSIPDLEHTHQRVVEAARIHDMAKPMRFRLVYQQDRFSHKWNWEYSFSGHRFNAFHDDVYVQMLAQLHHEYSVAGITKGMAQLRLDESTKDIAPNLALDLYTLEMCDQIEATFARAALGSEDPEERVFMDFQFQPRAGTTEYDLDPFPFDAKTSVAFSVEYVELVPHPDKREAVETATSDGQRRAALRTMQGWLVVELQTAPLQCKEVRLWPWMQQPKPTDKL